jgi:hypothetical protein
MYTSQSESLKGKQLPMDRPRWQDNIKTDITKKKEGVR